jgi:hypoxanthine phosphoribosyltransferase
MKKIRVKDREFEVFIPAEKIDSVVSKIAAQINTEFKDQNPVFLVILNGAFMFASDLFKKLEMACEVSFVKLASYSGIQSSANVKELIGLNDSLKGRQVIIVEDIIDTGITMDYLIRKLYDLGVSELRIASLFFKPQAFKKDFTIDYIGMSIPNDFIVGYGLDYDGCGRNYGEIYKIID